MWALDYTKCLSNFLPYAEVKEIQFGTRFIYAVVERTGKKTLKVHSNNNKSFTPSEGNKSIAV